MSFSDPLNDPRFPNRPNTQDFWRLSEVQLKHDADAVEKGVEGVIGQYVDERSLVYFAEHHLGNAGIITPTTLPAERLNLIGLFIVAFCLGSGFEQAGGHRDG